MSRWNTTYELISNNDSQFNHAQNMVLMRIQHLSNSKRKVRTIVNPSRWSQKPGQLEDYQSRKAPWLVKNAISQQDDIVPMSIKLDQHDVTVFLALSDEEKQRFHPNM